VNLQGPSEFLGTLGAELHAADTLAGKPITIDGKSIRRVVQASAGE